MTTKSHIAVLGLGAMGHAFATNLLKNEFPVSAWNRTAAKGKNLLTSGITLHATPQAAVADANIIIAMLTNGDITLEVLQNILPECPQGAIFCQMGTIGIQATQKAHQLLQEQRPDMIYLDAPVSGTKKPAEDATLTIFASSDGSHPPEIEPVFEALGKKTLWFNRVGTSQEMKLVVNSFLVLMMQGIAESMQLAQKFGFTPSDFWNSLDGGPLAAPYVKAKLNMIEQGDYTPQMELRHAIKDADLARDNAIPGTMPELEMISNLWKQAEQAGFSQQDLSSIFAYLGKEKAP